MFEKILTAIFSVLFIGVMVLAVIFGIAAKSAWVGVLAFIGVLLSLGNIVISSNKDVKKVGLIIVHFLGLVCFGTASYLAGYEPRWMVVIFMAFSMIPLTFASESLFKESKTAGFIIVLIALISAPLAIALPTIIQNLSLELPIMTGGWAWSLAVSGVAIALIALVRATLVEVSDYFICSVISIISLIGATWLAKAEAGWFWLIPWLALALSIGTGGFLFPRRRVKAKTIGILMAVTAGLVGIGFILMNTGVIPNLFQSASEREVDFEAALESTIVALDADAAKTADAEMTATQASLEDQERIVADQTKTAQAKSEHQAQTSTSIAELTLTSMPDTADEDEGSRPPDNNMNTLLLPALSQSPGPGFFSAVGQFLWGAIKSIWGIIYLLLLIGLGQLWIKRWGGVSFIVILLILVGIFGGRQQGLLDLFIQLISTGPTTWWTYTLTIFQQSSGTIGWGVVAMAFFITLLMAPAFLITSRYSQKALSAQRVHEIKGTTAAEQFINRNMPGCQEMLATWLYILVSFAFPITLWVALRRLSSSVMADLPFWFIPDLAVPHWKPVWHFAYFALGAVFFLVYVLYIKLLSQIQEGNPFTKLGLWGAFPISVLLTLFAPGGVVLYQSVQVLLISILLPLVGKAPQPVPAVPLRPEPQRPKQSRMPPPKPKPAPYQRPKPKPKPSPTDFEAYLDEIQRRVKETKGEEEPKLQKPEPGVPHLAGEALASLLVPMVGGYFKSGKEVCVLDESGHLFLLFDGKIRQKTDLSLRNPSQLLHAKDDQLLVITRLGDIIPIKANQAFKIAPKKNLGKRIKQSAVNSYGTLLAYTAEDAPSRVHGYFISAERDQLFFDAGQAPVSCLAFSKNARYLAAGTTSGKIIVIDIATHQQVVTIPDKNYGPVEMLTATEDEKWVSVYSDGWVVMWDMKGSQSGPVELSNKPTSMAVSLKDDRIMVGDKSGYLWVYQKDLKVQDFSQQVQQDKVTHILTASDGAVITVGEGKILRRLTIE